MIKTKITTVLILSLFSINVFCSDAPPEYLLKEYIKEWSFPEKGDIVKKEKIFFKKVDADGDGALDLYLDDPGRCGSQGCNSSVYLLKNSKYCYAGPEVRLTVGEEPNKELKCVK